MKILLANKFFYCKGGSERVYFDTARLLEAHGNSVAYFAMQHPLNEASPYERYFVSRVDFGSNGALSDISHAGRILYSFEAKRLIEQLLKDEPVDIAHLNNIYHQISPSIIHSLKRYRVPVVMTLHDFKMVCPAYAMLRGDEVCQECSQRAYYHCFLNKCVKHSAAKSMLASVEMYLHHVLMNIYRSVDVFIAPSIFLKEKLEEMGFKGRMVHLPNFISCDGFDPSYQWKKNCIVYFGRLSQEKGLYTLLEAMKHVSAVTLDIIGDGDSRGALEAKVANEQIRGVRFLGYLKDEPLKEAIRSAMFVVFPSQGYENNPCALNEAFALGKPVIGSNRGGIPELIKDGSTGLLFEPGDAADLARKIQYLSEHTDEIVRMGSHARMFVEKELNPQTHYQALMRIYEEAKNSL